MKNKVKMIKKYARETLKILFTGNYWCLCQNSCARNIFWKEVQRIGSWNFKNICTVAVYCWYIKDAFAGFCQQMFDKKYTSEDILEKIYKKLCHT